MKHVLLIVIITILGCSSSEKIVEKIQQNKFLFYSGNLSGIDYIIITKKIRSNKEYQIVIDCNHYINGLGKTIFLKKTIFVGKGYSTLHFIKDTSMLSKLNYGYINNGADNFTPLSDEEYEVIKTAFIKYPKFTNKYNLNADSLRNYLGWLGLNN